MGFLPPLTRSLLENILMIASFGNMSSPNFIIQSSSSTPSIGLYSLSFWNGKTIRYRLPNKLNIILLRYYDTIQSSTTGRTRGAIDTLLLVTFTTSATAMVLTKDAAATSHWP